MQFWQCPPSLNFSHFNVFASLNLLQCNGIKRVFSECPKNSMLNKTGTIHISLQQKDKVGGLKYNNFCWLRVPYLRWHSGWVIKGQKMWGHNKWMVPMVKQNSQSWNPRATTDIDKLLLSYFQMKNLGLLIPS